LELKKAKTLIRKLKLQSTKASVQSRKKLKLFSYENLKDDELIFLTGVPNVNVFKWILSQLIKIDVPVIVKRIPNFCGILHKNLRL